MRFLLYVLGYLALMAGLASAAHYLRVPARWIGLGVVVVTGLGLLRNTDRR